MKTIKDVAKKAGVGVSTVSRYLNKNGYVSKESADKITKAMDELNYYPNAAAQSIKSKKSNTVALLIPNISNSFFPELASTIENVLSKSGYKMILCNVDESRDKEENYIDMILSNRIDGVISSTGFISQRLIDSGMPIISTDRMDVSIKQVVSVTSNHYQGATLATQHLIDCGCTKLIHVYGSLDNEPALLRKKAFEDTCNKYGVQYLTYHKDDEFDAKKVMKYNGAFIWADMDAIHFMNNCFENNIMIPADMQIVGFDNIIMSSMVYPKLTTVSQDIKGLGKTAGEMLIKMMKNETKKFNNIILDTELVERSTTKPKTGKNIVVIGSVNTDMTTQADSFPKVGETIEGNEFAVFPGGKGANQAVSASRLGGNVHFIGCVGNDSNGDNAIENLRKNNVDVNYIHRIKGVSTGIAQITIAEDDNLIIIVKGANEHVTPTIIDQSKDIIKAADLVLVQLEIPQDTVEYVLEYCAANNITSVLNPAPAKNVTSKMIENATFITPNETECEQIFGSYDEEILKKYPNKLILTKGDEGVYFHNGEKLVNVLAHNVKVMDTTGAGDTFNGGFSVGVVKGLSIFDAIEYGNKAAALSVQKVGAQTSMPREEDL